MSHISRKSTAARQRVGSEATAESRVSSRPARPPSASAHEPLLDEEDADDEVKLGVESGVPRYWPVRPTSIAVIWTSVALLILFLCNIIFVPLVMLVKLTITFWSDLGYRIQHRHTRWLRPPQSIRVAVVGAGWAGLQLAARLKEHGVHAELFEERDDVGGTWHPKHRSEGLRLHTPAWAASFAGFAPPDGIADDPDFRPPAGTMFDYLRSFAEHAKLTGAIRLNSKVEGIAYDSKNRTGTLSVRRAGSQELEEHGPFDMIVHTSLASEPYVPHIPAQGLFRGVSMHSSQLDSQFLQELLEDGQRRVVVVGGSKSACDAVVALTDAGISQDRITWLYRRPYQFCKVERFFHNRSWASTIRGYLAYHSFRLPIPLPMAMGPNGRVPGDGYLCMAWVLLWLLDYCWTYDSDPWSEPVRQQPHALRELGREWAQFHFGQLDARERQILGSHRNKLRGSPASFDEHGLVLEDGRRVQAEVVLWATGYRTGIEHTRFSRDGQPIANEEVAARPVFEHAVVPVMPVLLMAHTFFVALGPMRGFSLADYALYHSCARPPLTEQNMIAVAERHDCKQTPAQHMLFRPGFFLNMPRIHRDLASRHVLPTTTPEDHYYDLLVRARLSPLDMPLLPRSPGAKRSFLDHLFVPTGIRKWETFGRLLGDEADGEWPKGARHAIDSESESTTHTETCAF